MTDPLREASSVARIAVRESPDTAQTPPHAALPDGTLDVRAELPEAAATSPHSTCGTPSSSPGNAQQPSRAV